MIGNARLRAGHRSGHAEDDRLRFRGTAADEPGDDRPDDGQTVRFARVEHAAPHGPARLDMQDLRELLGVVAGDDDLRALDLEEDLLCSEQAGGEFGIRQGDERVELGLVMDSAADTPRHHDPAGADVEAEWLAAVQFGVVHHEISPGRRTAGRRGGSTQTEEPLRGECARSTASSARAHRV